MDWAKDRLRTIKDVFGPRASLAAVATAVFGLGGTLVLRYRGQDMSGWLDWIPAIFGFVGVLAIACWRLMDYATRLRLELRGVTDLENDLDVLSKYFDEANNAIFNGAVSSDEEYGLWKEKWIAWQERVEAHLESKFGLRERNIFRNRVLFKMVALPDSFGGLNGKHNFDRSILAAQLKSIRKIIIRHSDRALAIRISSRKS
jgi:hypothetical protein